MAKRRKLMAAAFLSMIIVIGVAAALLRPPVGRERTSGRSAIDRPVKAIGSVRASHIDSRRDAVHKALRCLNDLCDTGASEYAQSETRSLTAHLGDAPQPYVRAISAMLVSVLSYQTSHAASSGVSLKSAPNFPPYLIDRAAAACAARGHRRPGEITLSFAGDCTFGTVNGDNGPNRFPSVYRRSGQADYPFALIKPWFLSDDLTVVNFECTLTEASKTADKQWKFKGPERYAAIFPAGSVEAVGLSNNHSMDYLKDGFDDTLASFKKAHVPAFYQNVPYITTLQGVETVIIGDCTVVGENTTVIDGAPQRVLNQIRRYKRPGNIVIVVMHWGSELAPVPFPWQQALGREFIDAGADAVVGHHPHVVQGIELYKGKYIAYSLGNFAFGGNSLARHPETFVLRLRFCRNGRQTSALPASIVPCWITSSEVTNESGVLHNNYQPKPVFGQTADQTVALVLARSARLHFGIKKIDYLRL